MSKAVLTFAIYQGDGLLRRETVTQDIVKVGKDPRSHLRVDDDAASRMHAVVEVAGPDDEAQMRAYWAQWDRMMRQDAPFTLAQPKQAQELKA